MADTPLTHLIQPFCASLNDIVGEIKGIYGTYHGADEKFYKESYNLVTRDADEVSFSGLGASAFFGSVKTSVQDTTAEMQALSNLANSATRCHDDLNIQSSTSDGALQKAEGILDSYQAALTSIYGYTSYPYTYLLNVITTFDINTIMQQGSAAVSPAFQNAFATLIKQASAGVNSHESIYMQQLAKVTTAVTQLTSQMQSTCETWANQLYTDVFVFNTAIVSAQTGKDNAPLLDPFSTFPLATPLAKNAPGGGDGKDANAPLDPFPAYPLSTSLHDKDLGGSDEEGGGNAGNKGGQGNKDNDEGSVGIDIGPFWEGSAFSHTMWQQAGQVGIVAIHNVGTANIFNGDAGAHIGAEKDGTYDAGLIAGGNLFDLGDQSLFGNSNIGLNLGADLVGPSADAQIGIHKNSFGATIGASAITASGDVGANVAGVNVGLIGSVGAKIEFGFQVGAKTEIKLPFFSLGFTIGPAQTGTAD